jgi:histone acetyltransferase (RNA polymerase elongator complex component)
MKSRILPFWFPNLGCPTRCAFCDQSAAQGEAIVTPTPGQITDAILQAAREESNLPLVAAYYGGTFTALPAKLQAELLEPASDLLRQGVLSGIRVSTHPSFTSSDTMDLLCRHGITAVELGIQSFSTSVLAHNLRSYDRGEALKACQVVLVAGLDLVVQLMPFLPGATEADDLEAARLVAELAPSGIRLFPTVVLAGTKLEMWWREGAYEPPTVDATAARVAKMLRTIMAARIPVLRIGLQSSHSLDRSVLAGPYHPALGELCRSALLVDILDSAFEQMSAAGKGPPKLTVDHSLASLLTGHDQFGLRRISQRPSAKGLIWELAETSHPHSESGVHSFWQSEMFSVSLEGNVAYVARGRQQLPLED